MNTMKLIITALCLAQGAAYSQGVMVSPGNDYRIDFTSLQYIGLSPQPDVPLVRLTFTNNILDPGEQISIRVYDALDTSVPTSSFTFANQFPASVASWGWEQFGPTFPHPDHPGYADVSMVAGSVSLYSLTIKEMFFGGAVYGDTFVVPEPSSAFLLCLGVWTFFRPQGSRNLRARKMKRSVNDNVIFHPLDGPPGGVYLARFHGSESASPISRCHLPRHESW
jgi:hypothetical protein